VLEPVLVDLKLCRTAEIYIFWQGEIFCYIMESYNKGRQS